MSITEAIENAQTRVNAVYDKCEEKGATLSETKNLANLPATIDTIPAGGGEVIKAYVSGVNLWKPATGVHGWQMTSVSDVDVLLTRVGYQATGSDTFSPEVRVSFITENGFAGNLVNGSTPIYLDSTSPQKYDIIDGSVNPVGSIAATSSGSAKNRIFPFFFHNGQVFGEMGDVTMEGYLVPNARVPVMLYTPNKFARLLSSSYIYGIYGFCFLETGFWESKESAVYTFDTDLNALVNNISLSSKLSRSFVYFVEKSSNLFYAYYPTKSDFKSWKLVRINKTDSGYTPTDLKTFTYSEEPQNIFKTDSFGLAIQHKGVIQTETGYRLYLLTRLGYTVFDINTQDETLSSVEFHDWGMLSSNIGDRTIYKIQTFYDGTFSLDLSDGTTLICGFQSDSHNPFILEIVEPFIIEGDTTIYHRTFTETKLYWYQRPEGTATSSAISANAPISSMPYGPYNATKATVDWLAVPREDNRWNSTVLTGVIRMGAQTAKPEFDETNRRVIDVETAIKDEVSTLIGSGDWTLDDLNKVNGII